MNMGNTIVSIIDLYYSGKEVSEICIKTKTDKAFVLDVIKQEQINQAYEQYADDQLIKY
jgi:hypothetical protein